MFSIICDWSPVSDLPLVGGSRVLLTALAPDISIYKHFGRIVQIKGHLIIARRGVLHMYITFIYY